MAASLIGDVHDHVCRSRPHISSSRVWRGAARLNTLTAMGRVLSLASAGALTLAAALTAAAGPAGAADASTDNRGQAKKNWSCQTSPNPWLDRRVMNMAHSGGEHEFPMNTMYAFEESVALGADMLELDIQSTADGHLVVIHNSTVDETTNGTGFFNDMTLDQLRALDAAHWFVPGRSAVHGLDSAAYPLRGAALGEVKLDGHQPKDFRIPTLREVFKAFPDVRTSVSTPGTARTKWLNFLEPWLRESKVGHWRPGINRHSRAGPSRRRGPCGDSPPYVDCHVLGNLGGDLVLFQDNERRCQPGAHVVGVDEHSHPRFVRHPSSFRRSPENVGPVPAITCSSRTRRSRRTGARSPATLRR